MIEISDWSDLAKASRVLGDKAILERTFLQTEEAVAGTRAEKAGILDRLASEAGDSFYYLILNVDNPDEGIEEQAREWLQLSREAIACGFPRR